MADKYQKDEKVLRGQTLRTEHGRDRSDDLEGEDQAVYGNPMGGGKDNLSHSIQNGKVPQD